jgi:hypothetical protein
MTDLQKVQHQLNKGLAELMNINLDENELLYDYIFEAHRLVKKLTIPVVSHRRELLKGFANYLQSDTGNLNYDFTELVSDYLDTL